jgi:hypothetical protein
MKHGGNNHIVENIYYQGKFCIEKKFGASDSELLKFRRELSFYEFCKKIHCTKVPKLFGSSNVERIIYLERIEGRLVENFTKNFFASSIEFIGFINKKISLYDQSLLAQEHLTSPNCFSHYLTIRLVQALKNKRYLPTGFKNTAEKYIEMACNQKFNLGPLVVNPSDLGTHNTLEASGSYIFIDFEYAGIDTFAKLAYDYYLHPSNLQDEINLNEFFNMLSGALNIPTQIPNEQVFKLFSIWWVLRLLNNLDPEILKSKLETNLINKEAIPNYIQQRVDLISKYWGYLNA